VVSAPSLVGLRVQTARVSYGGPGRFCAGEEARLRRYPTARQRPSYRELEAQLADALERLADLAACARDELADAEEAMLAAVVVAKLVSRYGTPSNPFDSTAERRILGALVSGRAALRDVADLAPSDFLGAGHAALFTAILTQFRREQVLGARVRPSARRDPALRAYVAAETRARALDNALVFRDEFAAWVALQGLPRPGMCPRRDIVRVEELARWRRGER